MFTFRKVAARCDAAAHSNAGEANTYQIFVLIAFENELRTKSQYQAREILEGEFISRLKLEYD